MTDSRRRFSDRVADYVRFRPGYPPGLVAELLAAMKNTETSEAADIGSGTGIFTRLLLERGIRVYAVEPNANMRQAAESHLASYPDFVSIDGDAENTGLAGASVDLVTAAQAFHWFNNDRSRAEFRRILKPGGRLALIWNRRRLSQPLQQAYDALLRKFAPEYGRVNHMNLSDDDLARFFSAGRMQVLRFDNSQRLDFDALIGLLKSASYCPAEDTREFGLLRDELRRLFARFADRDCIDLEYDTELYYGPVAG
ncbi:MAG: class I SAM-dependent methyltransferase [Gammaproteobacteria bacterium]|nr:class I SAM-dependent methyltransferase [Gammaproteobacteria bacterium]MDH3535738.1 class I SAM-dependent methyltransferase [Gammaproteobacteria bacterium]